MSDTSPHGGVLLTVAYDGTAFHGWAAQPGARTVEAVLVDAVSAMVGAQTSVRGASRTDAGVHAQGQLVAFDTTKDIPCRGWVLGLNQRLPEDVSVRVARGVAAGFSPRFAAKIKRYRYRLLLDPVREPRHRATALRVGFPLNLELTAEEAQSAVGSHDFRAFRTSRDARPSTVRIIVRCAVEREADPRIVGIVVEGTAFLHNMVRILAGTILEVGAGRRPRGAISRAIASGDRRDAGITAAAHGLTLEQIEVADDVALGEPWPR